MEKEAEETRASHKLIHFGITPIIKSVFEKISRKKKENNDDKILPNLEVKKTMVT